MKNILILAGIILVIIAGGIYLYPRAQNESLPNEVGEMIVIEGEANRYENLSSEGKGVLEDYVSHYVSSLKRSRGDAYVETYADELELSRFSLYYYDSSRALIGHAVSKPGLPIYLFARDTWEKIPGENGCDALNGWGDGWEEGIVSTKEYLVAVYGSHICAYRAGNASITLVPGSRLEDDSSYAKWVGLQEGYSLSFNETTKTLSVDVFKKDYDGEGRAKEFIRSAQFILE